MRRALHGWKHGGGVNVEHLSQLIDQRDLYPCAFRTGCHSLRQFERRFRVRHNGHLTPGLRDGLVAF